MNEFVKEQMQNAADAGTEIVSDKVFRAQYTKFTSGTVVTSPHCKIISRQKVNFMKAVYGLVNLEFSLPILMRKFPHLHDKKFVAAYRRTLLFRSEGGTILRTDAAEIGAVITVKEKNGFLPAVLAQYRETFRTVNIRRLSSPFPPFHQLLNFHQIVKRIKNAKQRWEQEKLVNDKKYQNALSLHRHYQNI
jgi:hypothetical protein